MDTSAPHSLYDAQESHHTSMYPMLSWLHKEVHSLHGCLRWCLHSSIIAGTWWNWFPNNILISHLHWHTNEMEHPRTGCLHTITKWNYYLQGADTIFHNDHKTLAKFLNGKNSSNKVNSWGLELVTYNITFEWISGAQSKAADCLSRLVELPNGTNTTVKMLTATYSDGPAFNTRSKTSHQTATNTEPSSTPSNMDTITQDFTPTQSTQDITLKSLMNDKL